MSALQDSSRPVTSVIQRLIRRTGLPWYGFTAIVSGALVLLAVGSAFFDGTLGEFFSAGHWRSALLSPVIIAYMLGIIPPLWRAGDNAIMALRPLVPLDDDAFNRLIATSGVTPKGEWIAFGSGFVLILSMSLLGGIESGFSWTALYVGLAGSLMAALLVWEIYIAIGGTKPLNVIHRHLSNVEIFDLRPFEPIGRHSLVSALAFVGGAIISTIFGYGEQDLLSALITYGILGGVAVVFFFLSMRGTHRVLDAAKDEELAAVRIYIANAYRSLEGIAAGSPEIGALSTKLNLWQAYEQRLKGAKTWPYNFGMLRTLFISVLTPVVLNVVQRLIGQLFS